MSAGPLLVLAALLLAGCTAEPTPPTATTSVATTPATGTAPTATPDPTTSTPPFITSIPTLATGPDEHVPFAYIAVEDEPARRDPQTVILSTSAEWTAFWNGTPPETVYEPRFPDDQVAVIILGERPNDCYDLEIDDIVRRARAPNVTVIQYTERVPDPALPCFDETRVPYEILMFKAQPSVTFERSERMTRFGSFRVVEDTTWRLLDEGPTSAINESRPARFVIEDNATWAAFWANHTGKPNATPPAVDFGARRVAALGFQERPNACYSWTLQDVVRRVADDGLEVRVLATSDDGTQTCHPVAVRPHVIVEIEKGGTVSWSASAPDG